LFQNRLTIEFNTRAIFKKLAYSKSDRKDGVSGVRCTEYLMTRIPDKLDMSIIYST